MWSWKRPGKWGASGFGEAAKFSAEASFGRAAESLVSSPSSSSDVALEASYKNLLGATKKLLDKFAMCHEVLVETDKTFPPSTAPNQAIETAHHPRAAPRVSTDMTRPESLVRSP